MVFGGYGLLALAALSQLGNHLTELPLLGVTFLAGAVPMGVAAVRVRRLIATANRVTRPEAATLPPSADDPFQSSDP